MKLHFVTYNKNPPLQILKPVNPQIIDPLTPNVTRSVTTSVTTSVTRSFNRYNMINQIQNGGKCLACNK